ncbi:MAG: putative toxin-antitoxin system toxin component, PIN family [Pseudoxanthomonas sp.]
MWRIVVDTSILVAAFRSRSGASNALLTRIALGEVKPLVTTALFLEYEDVLKRPEHRLATGMSETAVDSVLAALASASLPVEVHFRWRPQLRDPADEFVLEAAVNGRADALVTHNVRDFGMAPGRFGLKVMTPAEFLGVLRK